MTEATTLAPQDFIATELAKFNVSDAAIAEMAANFLSIKVADHNDRFHAEVAHSRRMEVRALRVTVEKTRKELKEGFLRGGQAIDAEAKRITALLTPIEEHLQAQEDIVAKHKARMEAEAKAKEAERLAAEEAARQAERDAIEAERAKLEAERRAIEEERARIENEKRRQVEIETARQQAAERAAFETEQRLKREAEAKLRAEQEEAARIARIAAARPDQEKLVAFAEQVAALQLPTLEDEMARNLGSQIAGKLDELVRFINSRAELLGGK